MVEKDQLLFATKFCCSRTPPQWTCNKDNESFFFLIPKKMIKKTPMD